MTDPIAARTAALAALRDAIAAHEDYHACTVPARDWLRPLAHAAGEVLRYHRPERSPSLTFTGKEIGHWCWTCLTSWPCPSAKAVLDAVAAAQAGDVNPAQQQGVTP